VRAGRQRDEDEASSIGARRSLAAYAVLPLLLFRSLWSASPFCAAARWQGLTADDLRESQSVCAHVWGLQLHLTAWVDNRGIVVVG